MPIVSQIPKRTTKNTIKSIEEEEEEEVEDDNDDDEEREKKKRRVTSCNIPTSARLKQ